MNHEIEQLVDTKIQIYTHYLKGLSRQFLVFEYYDRMNENINQEQHVDKESEQIIELLVENMSVILEEDPTYEHIIVWTYLNRSH